jgi:hypothetical protein
MCKTLCVLHTPLEEKSVGKTSPKTIQPLSTTIGVIHTQKPPGAKHKMFSMYKWKDNPRERQSPKGTQQHSTPLVFKSLEHHSGQFIMRFSHANGHNQKPHNSFQKLLHSTNSDTTWGGTWCVLQTRTEANT